MVRSAALALVTLVCACAPVKVDSAAQDRYSGTVQKVLRVVREGTELPGLRFLGRSASALGRALRQDGETHQYVVRTPEGNVIAQSDDEFAVGDCVAVIPRADTTGPAFRYGDAAVVMSESCTEKQTPSRSADATL